MAPLKLLSALQQSVSSNPSHALAGPLSLVSATKPGAMTAILGNPTEDDVANLFAEIYEKELRYDHTSGKWYEWDGSHWKGNETRIAFDYARKLNRRARRNGTRLGTRAAAEGVEVMAQRDQRLSMISEGWDRDPHLLATPSGTVDLKTGSLKTANPLDHIRHVTAIAPATKGTPTPVFDTFLDQTTAGNKDFQRFLLQVAGYALTGVTKEQCLFFIYGAGGNGKSVFLSVLSEIMGGYAATSPMETFAASKHQRHLAEVAMLDGPRLVTVSETEKGQAWSESRINLFTGGDLITANFMRQNHFTFRPKFKLVIVGNHKPQLNTVNEAARRRFNIIPFEHKPATPDRLLLDKLRHEYGGILRKLIDGCLDWQANGLVKPAVVADATAEYFEEQDLIGQFLKERCEVDPAAKVSASELFYAFSQFATQHHEQPGTQKVFGNLIGQKGFKKTKSNTVFYLGLKLVSDIQYDQHF